jgi:hypothetical protein
VHTLTCMLCVERSVPKRLYTCCDVIEGFILNEIRLLDSKILKCSICTVSRIVLLSVGLSHLF